MARERLRALAFAAVALIAWGDASALPACRGTLYLTFDTGNMAHAETIAQTLKRHAAQATFFLANEKTFRGDHALDASWRDYWIARANEGHAFGSHTWRHGKAMRDSQDGSIVYRPEFPPGKPAKLSADDYCQELRRVDTAFHAMTGRALDPLWRAPGGRTTPNALAAAQRCGYKHVGWAPAGFIGDELPSDRYPNDVLVERAVKNLRDGDVLMMHLGIWSREKPFAPHLDDLLTRLSARGFCFAPLAAAR